MKPAHPDPTHFIRRVAELRLELRNSPASILSTNTGATLEPIEPGKAIFSLPLWGQATHLSYPEFIARNPTTGQELPLPAQALLLYYFSTADGTPQAGRWISFSELPDGRFYNQAFQGYTGHELRRAFQDGLHAFEQAALDLGGVCMDSNPEAPGDCAFSFTALPRMPLLVIFWRGDEDDLAQFPHSFQVLFDASARHYLPTDVCAILGGMLTRRLVAARPTPA